MLKLWLPIEVAVEDMRDLEFTCAEYLTEVRDSMAPATVRRRIASFRAYAKFMGTSDFLDDYGAPKQVPGIPHPIEGLHAGVLAMIEVCRRPSHKALIALCGLCGLRVSEAVGVKHDDIVISGGEITLTVYGKGYKTRHVPVSDEAWAWLAGPWSEAATLPHDPRLVPMVADVARRTITRMGRRAGLEVASHDLRSTFATEAYMASDKDINVVQELLGHASVDTTRGYTQVSDANRRKAVDFS